MATRVRRIEMLLDSYYQSKQKNPKIIAEALAHVRAIRNEIRKKDGWDWSLIAKKLPDDKQTEIQQFGYITEKRWTYPNFKGSVVPLEPEAVA